MPVDTAIAPRDAPAALRPAPVHRAEASRLAASPALSLPPTRPAEAAEPTIVVTIGSVDLRPPAAPVRAAAAAPAPRGPRLDLQHYLQRRREGFPR